VRYSRRRFRGDSGRLALAGMSLLIALGSLAIAYGAWTDDVDVTSTVSTGTWVVEAEAGGSPGFWRNWDKEGVCTLTELESLLADVDAASDWLGPTTAEEMEGLFQAAFGPGSTQESRFQAHYLCTCLNLESGRLSAGAVHDISSIDNDNYLGMPTAWSCTVPDISAAIEAKHGTGVTGGQFAIMLEVCESLHHPA
jgi:hypothetical protein